MIDRDVAFLGVPMDLGGGRRGTDMGPSAVRIAGIERAVRALGLGFEDLGNIPVEQPHERRPVDPRARFLEEIASSREWLRHTYRKEIRNVLLKLREKRKDYA